MKATELRVNNWYNSTKFQTPVICEFADFAELSARADGAKVDEDLINEMFEPIPLTEEWLLIFGLEKMKCISFNWQNEWIIKTGKYGWEIGVLLGDFPEDNPNCGCVSVLQSKNIKIPGVPRDIYDKNNWTKEDEIRASKHKITAKKWRQPIAYYIKYVHQLQNLYFALTNEELIIKP